MKFPIFLIAASCVGVFFAAFFYEKVLNFSQNDQLVLRHNDLQVQQENKAVKARLPFFKFEDYPTKSGLEDALKKYLHSKDTIEEIDQVLVGSGRAFRSDNLISYRKDDSDYKFGTSSAENYVFYFKPSTPNGKHGWEKADDGWALKVTYMGSGAFFGKSKDEEGAGLLSIDVLSTPSDANVEFVNLVKGLLQDKLDREPKDKFLQEEWDKRKAEFLQSPCKSDPSFECLVEHSIFVLDLTKNPLAILYYPYIANIIISEGNVTLSKTLLGSWPDKERIIAFEEGLPRTQRYSPENIQPQLEYYSNLRMRLLYLAGDYDQADKILDQDHSAKPNGEDFGAIMSLVNKGDLEKALAVSKYTLTWPLIGRDPRENSSAIMHCNSYEETAQRAQSMGALGLAFFQKGQYKKSYEVLQLLRTYIDNKAYGQKSYCHLAFANASYTRIARALILHYAKQQDKENVKKLLDEQVDLLIVQNPIVTNYNFGSYERLAKLSVAVGEQEPLLRLTKHMQSNLKMTYTDMDKNPHDPMVVMFALEKRYDAAFDHMSSSDYSANDLPPDNLGIFPNTKIIPNDIVNLNGLIAAARSLKDVGDKGGSIIFLEKAHSIMGHRKPEYDTAIENLGDYIFRANIYYDFGMKDKSKVAMEKILQLFDATTAQDYRGGGITLNFFGNIALLIAKHKNVQALQTWADSLPYFYEGHAYAQIGKLLVEEKRWDELDFYMPTMARVMSVDDQPPSNWRKFTKALIEAKEFDRYTKFLLMVNKGNSEDKKRSGGYRNQVVPDRDIEPQYTPNQKWLMIDTIGQNIAGNKIPVTVISPVMDRYIEDCPESYFVLPHRGADKATASDRMASCLLQLVSSYQQEKLNELREQEYRRPF